MLKETPQLTVPFHYSVRVVIIASSSSHSYFLALLLFVIYCFWISAADEGEWTSRAYRQAGHTPFNIGDVTKRARTKATGRSAVLCGSKYSKSKLDKKNTGGVRKIAKSSTKKAPPVAAAKNPSDKVVAKKKKLKKNYLFFSRGYL